MGFLKKALSSAKSSSSSSREKKQNDSALYSKCDDSTDRHRPLSNATSAIEPFFDPGQVSTSNDQDWHTEDHRPASASAIEMTTAGPRFYTKNVYPVDHHADSSKENTYRSPPEFDPNSAPLPMPRTNSLPKRTHSGAESTASRATEPQSGRTERRRKDTLDSEKSALSPSGSTLSKSSISEPEPTATDYASKKARAAAAVASKNEVIAPNKATTSEDFIQVAIQYHEQNNLEESLRFFKRAADANSPIGMFLYGISLRHGWGCEPNQQLAFHYLQKVAEIAVSDLNNIGAVNSSAARHELVLSIYELGMCFRHGWGIIKNKVTAAYYFEIAANLGDPDAQNDLAWCYEHGVGVKRNNAKAAHYYRKAASQGHEILGNSWIWKPKYNATST